MEESYMRSLAMGYPLSNNMMMGAPNTGWGYAPCPPYLQNHGYTQPNTPDLLLHRRRQEDEPEVSLDDKKNNKHVSFDTGILRSQTVGSIVTTHTSRTLPANRASAEPSRSQDLHGHSLSTTPSKSSERLIDGRKTPDYALYSELFTPELARQIVLDRLKKTSMRTQATQTDVRRHQQQQLQQLQQIQQLRLHSSRTNMISESVQTNGGLGSPTGYQQADVGCSTTLPFPPTIGKGEQHHRQHQHHKHHHHSRPQSQELSSQRYQVKVYNLDSPPEVETGRDRRANTEATPPLQARPHRPRCQSSDNVLRAQRCVHPQNQTQSQPQGQQQHPQLQHQQQQPQMQQQQQRQSVRGKLLKSRSSDQILVGGCEETGASRLPPSTAGLPLSTAGLPLSTAGLPLSTAGRSVGSIGRKVKPAHASPQKFNHRMGSSSDSSDIPELAPVNRSGQRFRPGSVPTNTQYSDNFGVDHFYEADIGSKLSPLGSNSSLQDLVPVPSKGGDTILQSGNVTDIGKAILANSEIGSPHIPPHSDGGRTGASSVSEGGKAGISSLSEDEQNARNNESSDTSWSTGGSVEANNNVVKKRMTDDPNTRTSSAQEEIINSSLPRSSYSDVEKMSWKLHSDSETDDAVSGRSEHSSSLEVRRLTPLQYHAENVGSPPPLDAGNRNGGKSVDSDCGGKSPCMNNPGKGPSVETDGNTGGGIQHQSGTQESQGREERDKNVKSPQSDASSSSGSYSVTSESGPTKLDSSESFKNQLVKVQDNDSKKCADILMVNSGHVVENNPNPCNVDPASKEDQGDKEDGDSQIGKPVDMDEVPCVENQAEVETRNYVDNQRKKENMKLNFPQDGDKVGNNQMWHRMDIQSGEVNRKRACFEIGSTVPVGCKQSTKGMMTPSSIPKDLLGEFTPSPTLARSPAMHEGFRLKDWRVERTPINTPDSDLNICKVPQQVSKFDHDELEDEHDDDYEYDDEEGNNDSLSLNSETDLGSKCSGLSSSFLPSSISECVPLADPIMPKDPIVGPTGNPAMLNNPGALPETNKDAGVPANEALSCGNSKDQVIDQVPASGEVALADLMSPDVDQVPELVLDTTDITTEAALHKENNRCDYTADPLEADADISAASDLKSDCLPDSSNAIEDNTRNEAKECTGLPLDKVESENDIDGSTGEANVDQDVSELVENENIQQIEQIPSSSPAQMTKVEKDSSCHAQEFIDNNAAGTEREDAIIYAQLESNLDELPVSPLPMVVQPPAGFGDSPEKNRPPPQCPSSSPKSLELIEKDEILLVGNPHASTSAEHAQVSAITSTDLSSHGDPVESGAALIDLASGLPVDQDRVEEANNSQDEESSPRKTPRGGSYLHPEIPLTQESIITSANSVSNYSERERKTDGEKEETEVKEDVMQKGSGRKLSTTSWTGVEQGEEMDRGDVFRRGESVRRAVSSSSVSIDTLHQNSEERRCRKSSLSGSLEREGRGGVGRSKSNLKHRLKSRSKSSERILQAVIDQEDEIKGIYTGEYNKQSWVYVGEVAKHLNTQEESSLSLKRSASIESTQSEKEFSKRFQAITHRMVHRKSTSIMYSRILERTFDCNKKVIVRRVEGEFGFRIHGSRPVVVSAIEPGTPAFSSGLCVGDILLTVNGVNVLDLPHTEVVKVAQKCNGSLELGLACTEQEEEGEGEGWNCVMAQLEQNQQVISAGVMWKKKRAFLPEQQWTKRWFVLRADGCLYSFKSELELRPSGALLLPGCTVTHLERRDQQLSIIQIVRPDGGSVEVGLTTEAEAEDWRRVLTQSAENWTSGADIWLEVARKRANLPPPGHPQSDCKGVLQHLISGLWKSRNFVLSDGFLYIYSEEEEPASGVIFLHGYKAQPVSCSGRRHAFQLTPTDPELKHFFFHAQTETEKKRWLAALEFSIDRWMRLS